MKLNRLVIALAVGVGHGAWAAGNVDFVAGEAGVISRDGQPRGLARGDRIVEGDTLVTGAGGEILLATDDSGVLALRPGSRLLIDRFQATGTDRDGAVLNLLRGGLRAVTGWIGKTAPSNWRLATPTATVGIRGTEIETAIVEEGAEPGTYQQVISGEAVLGTSAGSLLLAAGQAGRAASGDQAPQLLPAVPAGIFPARASDARVELLRQDAQGSQEERLRQRQDQLRRSGGPSPQGNPRISAQCTPDAPAQRALDDFLRAYEQGNTALLQQRLDPALIGYGILINDIMGAAATQRQTQIRILDRQAQCGPDIAVIDFAFEKRFLDVATFQPVVQRGRGSVLVSGLGSGNEGRWMISGFTGDNPLRTSPSDLPANLQVLPQATSYAMLPGCATSGPVAGAALVSASATATVPMMSGTCTASAPSCSFNSPLFGTVPGTASAVVTSCTQPVVGATQVFPINGTGSAPFSGPGGSAVTLSATVVASGSTTPPTVSFPFTYSMTANVMCTATVTLPPASCAPTPGAVPVNITVQDASRAGQPSVPLEVAGNNGDRETLLLPGGANGTFTLTSLPFTKSAAPVAGSGRLELNGPVSYTLTYRRPGAAPVVRTFTVTP
ncbi:MAG: FecR domain-containing protein [Pseudomonadota bacterium]